jgi:16S rRNA (adenine1518-N6/adenine1519-N6)-dimethyltransferase
MTDSDYKTMKKGAAKHQLRKRQLAPKKSMGQNFLVDDNVYRKILSVLRVDKSDLVLEIGAGLGGLTKLLCKVAGKVVAIEKDDGLYDYLTENFGNIDNLELIHDDALDYDFSQLKEKYKHEVIAVSNLPYNVATPIIFRILEQRATFRRMYFMLQLEVAERIVSLPGNRAWGRLGIFCQTYTRPAIMLRVTPNSFYPQPEVHSALVYFEMLKEPRVPDELAELFNEVIRTAFSARRKTLRNTLKSTPEFTPDEVAEAGLIANLDLGRRAETLEIEEFVALTVALDRVRGERGETR